MISGKIPKNEAQRLAKLRSLDILDTLEEEAYDDLTFIAAKICETPISLVSLVDDSRQWFKSHFGLDARETPREQAFCAHAINQDDLLIVENTELDDRFKDNPLVTGPPDIRFYAGAPLILEDDVRVGTLCVIDTQPRTLNEVQKSSLKALARQVVAQLKLRLRLKEMIVLDKAKDDFLSVVSHELRTPTTSLYGSLKILENKAESVEASVRPMVDIAVRNSEQLLKIVNDILDVATMESGKLNVTTANVDLFAVAKNSLELNQAYLDKFGCEAALKSTEGSAAIFVRGDKQRLLQVATNLISNAAKFSRANGKVIVELKVEDGLVEFSVTDFGVGIAAADQEKLFKKFQQFGFDKNQQQAGTGLGLTITKHILEAHNSKIEFESVPGERTTFFFKLPIKD
ncbi:MAG: GAF domain-containing sensor histidine kinase [Acidiferrobacterales bacterium]|nr:GAF domain-containing sensor histidine kinase [Acidiferrobacterales bacterium]